MVDREARRKYAELVRQFISGRMTVDDYENRLWEVQHRRKDPALTEVLKFVVLLCEEAAPQRMTEKWGLNKVTRRQAVQAILFLQTDQEYEWRKHLWDGSVFLITAFCVLILFALLPEMPFLIRFVLSTPLIVAWQCYEQWQRKRKRSVTVSDKEAWPFLRQADLAEAARHPRLLNGKKTMP